MKNIKNLKVRVGALALVASTMFTLSGCVEEELAPSEDYDIVSIENSDDSLSM